MLKTTQFDALVLSGGNARRLEQHRKVIQPKHYPSLQKYWQQEGPKGLTILMIDNQPTPLLDLHLQPLLANDDIQQITLGLGFASNMIIQYYQNNSLTKKLNFTQELNPAGTIAPLLQCYLNHMLSDRPLIMSNGDNVLNIDYQRVYQSGLAAIRQLNLPEDEMVINILTKIKWQDSAAFGVVDYDAKTSEIHQFLEKQPIEQNPYITENNARYCYINSGFSIILNPITLIEKFVSQEVFSTMEQLMQGALPYKEYEAVVKYENLYGKLAASRRMIGVYSSNFWADSGSEVQIRQIEEHYRKKGSK